MGGGSWCLNLGVPSSMVERRRNMLSSDDVVVLTCSQLTDVWSVRRIGVTPVVGFPFVECSWSSVHIPAMN